MNESIKSRQELEQRLTSEFLKGFRKLPQTRILLHTDRSTARDIISLARFRGSHKTGYSINDIHVIYQGPPRTFILVDGGVLCWRCGKMRNTMRSAQKHFKQAHQ